LWWRWQRIAFLSPEVLWGDAWCLSDIQGRQLTFDREAKCWRPFAFSYTNASTRYAITAFSWRRELTIWRFG
jgi:hypothetical protein